MTTKKDGHLNTFMTNNRYSEKVDAAKDRTESHYYNPNDVQE
jgi:hypothetical protein